MPDSQFYDFITNKVKHSLTEPGEAVGLLCAQVGYLESKEVSKGAKIRNRYNQVPHLTQDTNGKVTNSQ